MKKFKSSIRVRDIRQNFMLMSFESIEEAIEILGKDRALLYINYSYHLTQRDRTRAIIEEKHRK